MFLLAREDESLAGACLPGKKMARALACPGGARSWMDQDSIDRVSCLPGKRLVRALACPGGRIAFRGYAKVFGPWYYVVLVSSLLRLCFFLPGWFYVGMGFGSSMCIGLKKERGMGG
jgi:hypothetical protein